MAIDQEHPYRGLFNPYPDDTVIETEVNQMLMINSPQLDVGTQLDYSAQNDELNRLLSAAVVSKSFCKLLLSSPELALVNGYQGEAFNLSDADRSWLFSIKVSSLTDLAANMVTHQQKVSAEIPVKVPLQPVPHYVRVN